MESRLDGSPNQPCLLCPESKKIKQQMDDKIYSVEFEEVISRQQKYCDEIIQNLTDPKISGVT